MKRLWAFSKLLLIMESGLVLYSTGMGFRLAMAAVEAGYLGTLPWVTGMMTACWGAYGASAAFYYNKAKAENTRGGIVYDCAAEAAKGDDTL